MVHFGSMKHIRWQQLIHICKKKYYQLQGEESPPWHSHLSAMSKRHTNDCKVKRATRFKSSHLEPTALELTAFSRKKNSFGTVKLYSYTMSERRIYYLSFPKKKKKGVTPITFWMSIIMTTDKCSFHSSSKKLVFVVDGHD